MTPTEQKAEELIQKFLKVGCISCESAMDRSAIQSAIIAVEEIMKEVLPAGI